MLRDYLWFLVHCKKWWILPPLLVLAALTALVWLSANRGLAGFVYNV